MSFYTTTRKPYEPRTFNKPVFLKITPGMNLTFRILNGNAIEVGTHWIGGGSVRCLDDECPQCEQNKKIRMENPKDYQQIKGYSYKAYRVLANVLDRTPVKVCPKCQTEVYAINGSYATSCPACNTLVANEQINPSNKVKILSRSASLFEQLDAYDKSILDVNKEPVGITNFDIMLIVSGTPQKPNPVPVPTQNFDKVEVAEDQLFDLESVTPKVSRDEMLQIMRGVGLRDIFAARKASSSEDTFLAEQSEATGKSVAEIKQGLDELFSD